MVTAAVPPGTAVTHLTLPAADRPDRTLVDPGEEPVMPRPRPHDRAILQADHHTSGDRLTVSAEVDLDQTEATITVVEQAPAQRRGANPALNLTVTVSVALSAAAQALGCPHDQVLAHLRHRFAARGYDAAAWALTLPGASAEARTWPATVETSGTELSSGPGPGSPPAPRRSS